MIMNSSNSGKTTNHSVNSGLKESALDYVNNQLQLDITNFSLSAEINTGYPNLDSIIGSLYPGLYIIGAGSSIGKTTFVLQMADQLAMAGEYVVYFTLEQSRMELTTKSLSRITAIRNSSCLWLARTAVEIRNGATVDKPVQNAVNDYSLFADHICHVPGNFSSSMETIEKKADAVMQETNGIPPVIIVDYLQIVQDKARSDKEKIDHVMRELKMLQQRLDAVIIVISSINRSNYMLPIDFEAFKESGGIEYTADVVWGLQLQVLDDPMFYDPKTKIPQKRQKIADAKKANPRKVSLVCLKNRYGIASYRCGFNYYPAYDLFLPENHNSSQPSISIAPHSINVPYSMVPQQSL